MSLNQSTLHYDTNACATAQRRLQGMAHLIGNTPLLAIDFAFKGTERTIFAKCEQMNLTGSIKDRMVYHILKTAYASGQIHAGDTIVEVSSGNTGISCAAIGAAMGHPVVIFMPDWMSAERVQLIASYGAQVVTVSREQGGFMACLRMSEEYAATHPNVFLPRQFENPLNATDHEHTTGQEILKALPGSVDAFVAGYGTGGTLAGVGRAVKERDPLAMVIAMEPAEAALLCGEMPCCHSIEGVTGGFIPPLLRSAPLDDEIKVRSADALAMTRRLHRDFGLLVGTSSGANVFAALAVASKLGPNLTVVTIFCDRAER